jgi:glycosyltransferase involved in cell wall biosynthesis
MSPPRVVHVDLAREWRGGQQQLLNLVTAGPPPLAVVAASGGPIQRAMESAGVRVVPVAVQGRWSPGGARRVREALDELVREGGALVAAHDGHAAALCIRAAPAAPVVVHRRVDFVPSRAGYRRYRQAAGVIAVSRAVADVLRRGGVDRVHVVHDGVDPAPLAAAPRDPAGIRAALGVPATAPVVLAVGALVAHKAHRVLVEAMPLVPGAAFVVLGDGPLRGALWRRAHQLGVATRLHLPGWQPDVARWLRSADAFAHPSVEEGLGQAVIEAHVAGLPIVASRAGGIPELGVGVLVPPADAVALGVALRDALAGPAGQLRDTAFTTARMTDRTTRAYAAVLRSR